MFSMKSQIKTWQAAKGQRKETQLNSRAAQQSRKTVKKRWNCQLFHDEKISPSLSKSVIGDNLFRGLENKLVYSINSLGE